jgi:N-acetylglucosamine-6-sulfatase
MLDRRTLLKLAATVPGLLSTSAGAAQGPKSPGAPTKPNMIHILVDDMRFDDYHHMKNLKHLFLNKGVNFQSHFVTFPVCAPSRVSILTGLQAHNHGVLHNNGHRGGYYLYQSLEDNSLPVWLTAAGYHVGHIGKFINDYNHVAPDHVPPGYADWRVMSSSFDNYFNFTLNENGTQVAYDNGEYTTTVFMDKLEDFLATAPQPWALFFWPNCCHGPAIPAPRDAGTFANVDMPLPPSFNEADVSDKPTFIQNLPLLTDTQISSIQDRWRGRQETLQSLDRGLAKIMDLLTQSGQISNTHIMFSSDNGFQEGEHRINDHKNVLYEESARTPLYWLQPSGYIADCIDPVSNIDVTAAMVDLGGATAGRTLDGTSLLPLLSDVSAKFNRATLLQSTRTWGVATRRYRYMDWGKHRDQQYEVYDMTVDPYQLNNVAGQPAYAEIQADLAAALDQLRHCAGSTCQWTASFPPPPG